VEINLLTADKKTESNIDSINVVLFSTPTSIKQKLNDFIKQATKMVVKREECKALVRINNFIKISGGAENPKQVNASLRAL
jgi:hypothetical protein